MPYYPAPLAATPENARSLQTFLDFAGRAERHRIVGVKYKVREIEQKVSSPALDSEGPDACLDDLRRQLDALEEDAPVLPATVPNPL